MNTTNVVFLLLSAVLLLGACDDDVIDALPSRYIYYIDASGDVQRHDLTLDKNEAVGVGNVRYITSVAENGIVLFEKYPGSGAVLYGQCADGSIIPVPMPVSPTAGEEYVYGAAHPALSSKGHHAAWAVYRHVATENDSALWVQELCRFDCGMWKMSQTDLTAFIRQEMKGSGFGADLIVVEDVMISSDGSQTIASVRVTETPPGGDRHSQYLLVSWTETGLRLMLGKSRSIELLSFDAQCASLYFRSGGDYFSLSCSGGSSSRVTMDGSRLSLLTPHSFAAETGEYSSSFLNGDIAALTRLSDGDRTVVVESIRDITVVFPEITFGALGGWISVSPDGEWIVFPWYVTEADGHLFAVRRDRGKFRRIAQGLFELPASLSKEIPL